MLIENNYQSSQFFKNFYVYLISYIINLYQIGFFIFFNFKTEVNSFSFFLSKFKSILLDNFILCNSLISDLFYFVNMFIFKNETKFIFNFFYDFNYKISINAILKNVSNLNFFSLYFSPIDAKIQFLLNNEELASSSMRSHKFDNPIFKYDYKSGDYFPKL
jgi:hypothetical protein